MSFRLVIIQYLYLRHLGAVNFLKLLPRGTYTLQVTNNFYFS